MRPSLRLLVPSSPSRAPALAVGAPVVTSGGQNVAHLPLQMLVWPLSWAHRYSVLPPESTRIRPRLLGATCTEAVSAWAVAGRASSAAAAAAAHTGVRRMFELLGRIGTLRTVAFQSVPGTQRYVAFRPNIPSHLRGNAVN